MDTITLYLHEDRVRQLRDEAEHARIARRVSRLRRYGRRRPLLMLAWHA